jgi:hypothetical protein
MNVAFNKNNANDVATMLGVSHSVVTSWCRKGLIKATNVSDGDKKARWLISDEEVQRVSNLINKYGARMWITYSAAEPVEKVAVVPVVEVKKSEAAIKAEPSDEFVDLYWKIKEAKEELENVIARKNQLENLLADYEKQLYNAI